MVLAALMAPTNSQAQAVSEPSASRDHPRLEVNLGEIGYDTSELSSARWQTFTDFIDADHLAVAWLSTRKRNAAHPGEPTSLHVLVLDIRTGEKTGLDSYATPLGAVRFAGVSDGAFLTCTGGLLRIWSKEFKQLREKKLSDDHGCGGFGALGVSPSRKLLLLSLSRKPGQSAPKTLLNLETFSTDAEWTEDCSGLATSDHYLIGRCGKAHTLFVRSLDQGWQPFQSIPDRVGSVSFVADDVLAFGTKNQVVVTTVAGKQLFTASLPGRNIAMHFATSIRGDRFAVLEGESRGIRSAPLDMYPFLSQDRVAVYSLRDRRAIFALNLKGTSPWAPGLIRLNQVALSPDGTLLTVLSGGVLRVYRLPQ